MSLLTQAHKPILVFTAAAAMIAYGQSFDRPDSLADFVFSDPAAWQHKDGSLELFRQSDYKPPHRSPLNIALVADRQFGSFTFEADLLSTTREYDHRSMCLFFNFVDPAHYYYVHIGTRSDAHAHNIFIVNGADRTKISTTTTAGHDWGQDQWHKVKIVRDAESGAIEVHINGQNIMSARDKTFTTGHIGVGSFDDEGRIDNIRIVSARHATGKTAFFRRK
jgi:hypothetical protein